jgi:hypothetical protein
MAAMKAIALAPGCLALCMLAACSSSQPVSGNKTEPPPQPLTGLSALFHMYQVARASWALDAQVVKMSSVRVDGVPDPPPGQAIAWEATFYSPSLGRARSYTDSIVERLPELHKDVFAGPQQSFTGDSFLIAAVKKDTEGAYQGRAGRRAIRRQARADSARKEYAVSRRRLAHRLGRIREHRESLRIRRCQHRRVSGNDALA